MSAGSGTLNNPLLNRAVNMDTAMLMGILIELINSKPTACFAVPQFRLEQLCKAASKTIGPVNERKTLDSLCALYCLCLYFGLNTSYPKGVAFRVFWLFQALQSEALVTITNVGGRKIAMPDVGTTLKKSGQIDLAYKLELFTESLAVARLTCRELYGLMKSVFRVGRRGAQSLTFTADERKKHSKYAESIQPYSIYFMCAFAYSHMATMLHNAHNLNVYPGAVESFMMMVLTTTPTAAAAVQDTTHAQSTNTAEAIIQAVLEEEERKKQLEESTEAPKPVVVTLKLNFETFIETAHKLALFVAHDIFDDRNLQEVSTVPENVPSGSSSYMQTVFHTMLL
jgi:hypothetical protein